MKFYLVSHDEDGKIVRQPLERYATLDDAMREAFQPVECEVDYHTEHPNPWLASSLEIKP